MKRGARTMKELDTAYGGCSSLVSYMFLRIGHGEKQRGAYDGVRILDRDSAYDVSSDFEAHTEENDEEIVCFVVQDCLVELDYHGDGVEGCEDDREDEVGVVEPDGVGV